MYFAAERPVFFLFYWKDPSHGLCGNEQHNAFITHTDFVQFVLLTLQHILLTAVQAWSQKSLSAHTRVPVRTREAGNKVNLRVSPQNSFKLLCFILTSSDTIAGKQMHQKLYLLHAHTERMSHFISLKESSVKPPPPLESCIASAMRQGQELPLRLQWKHLPIATTSRHGFAF